MFKILPLIVSFALAGAGGVAVTAPSVLDSMTSTNVQTSANVNTQTSVNASVQDSSDLFLNANEGAGLSADTNVDVQNSASLQQDTEVQNTSDVLMRISFGNRS